MKKFQVERKLGTYMYDEAGVNMLQYVLQDKDAVLLLEVGGKHMDADGDTWERVE